MNEFISGMIEDLVYYAKENLDLTTEDSIFARNQLLDLFKLTPSYRAPQERLLDDILEELVKYGLEIGLAETGLEILFETKIMGLVTPSSGLVVKNFLELYKNAGSAVATNYLYRLSVNSNYIRMKDVKKNIRWYAESEQGMIGITINLSKPEKDAKQVMAEKNFKGVKYPKCMLCLENLGYAGSLTHPARQTLRIVPISVAGEKWHLQYSPYVYYDEHCIAFSDVHQPMAITPTTFVRLLDFVEIFPDYFLGSNADLPIVGGSILSHEHYQGGKKVLPMFSRPLRKVFYDKEVVVGIRDWYNSVVSIRGKKKEQVIKYAVKVLDKWKTYSDASVDVIPFSDKEPHNTITPIASKNGEEYCLDLILRNNRTDENHPYGIFHPTENMHNIKKEGIGLIEAMGLFILPGRLKNEISQMIEELRQEKIDFDKINQNPTLSKHLGLLVQLSVEGKTSLSPKEAQASIIEKINEVCFSILECTAVFKNTDKGQEAFSKFFDALS